MHVTPNSLYELGICICDKCGASCSLTYKYCKKCKEFVFIVKPSNQPETVGDIKTNNHESTN